MIVSANPTIEAALDPMVSALNADGYVMQITSPEAGQVQCEIVAGPAACVDCLVPKSMMTQMIETSLRSAGVEVTDLRLIYPVEDGPAATTEVSRIGPRLP
jgi:hypothetical protein